MTFTNTPDKNKHFGSRETTTISFRIPKNLKEVISKTVKVYINSLKEDNPMRIKTVQDSIREMVSLSQDVHDYIKKESSITDSKYLEILDNHNIDLIKNVMTKFPIERKIPIKTLKEEKKEEELREEELREEELRKVEVKEVKPFFHVYTKKELKRYRKMKRY